MPEFDLSDGVDLEQNLDQEHLLRLCAIGGDAWDYPFDPSQT